VLEHALERMPEPLPDEAAGAVALGKVESEVPAVAVKH
jgi:hypothetical protein